MYSTVSLIMRIEKNQRINPHKLNALQGTPTRRRSTPATLAPQQLALHDPSWRDVSECYSVALSSVL